jgi:PPOX class probable F420-dependent enzyme
MAPDEITRFLAAPRTAVLSSLDKDGAPHSAAMWFVAAGAEVLMWTYAKSQKAVNLRRDPRCALLAEEGLAYNELRGVLVTGAVTLIDDFESIRAIGIALYDRYTRPATGLPAEDGPMVEIERQARKRVGLSLPLTDVASWDHGKLGN